MAGDFSELNRLNFPLTVKYALRKLEDLLKLPQNNHTINAQQHVIDEYIFCYRDSTSSQFRALNSIESMVMVREVGDYLAQIRDPGARNILFITLFHPGSGKEPHVPQRLPILATLISLAVATHNVAVLEAAAVWMQQVGYLNGWNDDVCRRLVQDYFQSGNNIPPHFTQALKALPGATPLFTANLITSIVQLYAHVGKDKWCTRPPDPLIEMIVWWLNNNNALALAPITHSLPGISLPMTPITPIAPLFKLCVEAPFFIQNDTKNILCNKATTNEDLYSNLHLAILHALQAVPNLTKPMTQSQVLSCKQVTEIVAGIHRRIKTSDQSNEIIQESLNRLAQIILIAFNSRSITVPVNLDESQMRDALSRLPRNNRLIKTLLTSNKMWNYK